MQSVEVKDLQPGDVINVEWSTSERATRTVESVYWHEDRKVWAVSYSNGGWDAAAVIVSVSRDVPVVQSSRPLREPRPGVWERVNNPDINHPDKQMMVLVRYDGAAAWLDVLFGNIGNNPEAEYMVVPE